VAQLKEGIVVSRRKYALHILEETAMTDCRPVDSPMDPNQKLMANQGEPFSDPKRYRRLVGKLIYLTITRPDLSFAVGVVSQFYKISLECYHSQLKIPQKDSKARSIVQRLREYPIFWVL